MRKKHLQVLEGGRSGGNAPLDEDKPHEETVTIEGQKIVGSTELAWALDDPSGAVEQRGRYKGKPLRIWLPKSKVRLLTHANDLKLHDIEMPLWLAEEKGLV